MSNRNTFWVKYQIEASDEKDAASKARQISIEQSVEMPPEVVPDSSLNSIAQVQSLSRIDDRTWETLILFDTKLVDADPTQFLNVLFGNISLQPWCRIMDADPSYLSRLLMDLHLA